MAEARAEWKRIRQLAEPSERLRAAYLWLERTPDHPERDAVQALVAREAKEVPIRSFPNQLLGPNQEERGLAFLESGALMIASPSTLLEATIGEDRPRVETLRDGSDSIDPCRVFPLEGDAVLFSDPLGRLYRCQPPDTLRRIRKSDPSALPLAVSRSGRWIALGGRILQLLDTERDVITPLEGVRRPQVAAFDPERPQWVTAYGEDGGLANVQLYPLQDAQGPSWSTSLIGPVRSLVFLPGDVLAVANAPNQLLRLEAASGKPLEQLGRPEARLVRGRAGRVVGLFPHPAGQLLFSLHAGAKGSQLITWDLESGLEVRVQALRVTPRAGALSRDGRLLAIRHDTGVEVWLVQP